MNEDGEVNHRYFINKLVAPFYKDYIGLEYIGNHLKKNKQNLICLFPIYPRYYRWVVRMVKRIFQNFSVIQKYNANIFAFLFDRE